MRESVEDSVEQDKREREREGSLAILTHFCVYNTYTWRGVRNLSCVHAQHAEIHLAQEKKTKEVG